MFTLYVNEQHFITTQSYFRWMSQSYFVKCVFVFEQMLKRNQIETKNLEN